MSFDKLPNNDALISLKQSVCSDIELAKRQQWLASYYVVLLYSAIIGVVSVLSGKIVYKCVALTIFWLLSIAVFCAGVKILCICNKSLCSYRDLAKEIECRLNLKNITVKYQTEKNDSILYILIGSQFVACSVILYALCKLIA